MTGNFKPKKKKPRSNYRDKLFLGDHLYYHPIAKGNSGRTKALVNTTRDALDPYFSFLSEAIKAEEKRGQYEVKWKRIHSNFVIRIDPALRKIKIEKPTPSISILVDPSDLKEVKNRLIFEAQDEMLTFGLTEGVVQDGIFTFTPNIFPEENEELELNGSNIEYSINSLELNSGSKLTDENGHIIKIKSVTSSPGGWDLEVISNRFIKKVFAGGSELKFSNYDLKYYDSLFDGDNELEFEKMGNDLNLTQLPSSKRLKTEHGDEYTWHKVNKDREEFKIQLIDDDGDDSEKPISEHFFDDEVNAIYQGRDSRVSYVVKGKKPDDKILILKFSKDQKIELDKAKPIRIAVNTTNLKRQKDAIRFLNDSPVGSHQQLIKLFEKKYNHLWGRPTSKSIENWYVLNDDSYDGTIAQRNFVTKAVNTKDFAILEGPPGSGKTTAIIELILQLAHAGNKILLSASTHVAIDNVLERIKVKDSDNLIEPLRVGKVNNIDESVQQYQIDEKIKKYTQGGMSEALATRLVIDSANLVCGTTMGIQQHPDIKDRDWNSNLPMAPKYDYMIIDESSKTTFQEFLVPALQAKKWILVGDIKQLSPYIEQSHIIHNFNFLVNEETKSAIKLIFETLNNNCNPYAVEVSHRVMKYVGEYLTHWREQPNNPYKNKVTFTLPANLELSESDMLYILGSDLILFEEGTWDQYKEVIPKTHILIFKEEPSNSEEFFFQQGYLNKRKMLPKYYSINKEFSKQNNPIEMGEIFQKMMKEKSWAETISWRMVRVYERRMLKNPDSHYERAFELLKPIGKDNVVDRIYNMTLPSILESIQIGNGEKHRNSTTITEGFDVRDLEPRHEMLDYQHRMHPDISKFSREQFYTNNNQVALLDGRYTTREWDYHHYPKRSVWIDIPKNRGKGDRTHLAEAKRTITELKKFIEFTKENKNPAGEKWSVAVITFYRPQEKELRTELGKFCNQPNKMSRFEKDGVEIMNYTVDKFQGMEADIVFINMVRGQSIGFLDNINRLNVALTRAKFQRVILGDRKFFMNQKSSAELKSLAQDSEVML